MSVLMKKNVFWLLAAMLIPTSAVVAQDDYDEPQQIALSEQERQMVDRWSRPSASPTI